MEKKKREIKVDDTKKDNANTGKIITAKKTDVNKKTKPKTPVYKFTAIQNIYSFPNRFGDVVGDIYPEEKTEIVSTEVRDGFVWGKIKEGQYVKLAVENGERYALLD